MVMLLYTGGITMPGFQFYFELIGAVAFAISGAMVAVRYRLDLFGVLLLGGVTALGGGTLRDLLMGSVPPQNVFQL